METKKETKKIELHIRKDGKWFGSVEITEDGIITSGQIGYNHYDNFFDLLNGLQGFDISLDEIFINFYQDEEGRAE